MNMTYTIKTMDGYGVSYVATYNDFQPAYEHATRLRAIALPGEVVAIVQRTSPIRDREVTRL